MCTLAAARDRALARLGHESILKLVVYASDQTHVTFQKGARLVGIPPPNFRANFGSVSRSRCYRPARSSQNSSRHSFEGIQIRAFASLHQRQIRAPTRLLGN